MMSLAKTALPVLLATCLILTACSAAVAPITPTLPPAPSETPSPTATLSPTSTPTLTPTPTITPSPTATPLPPLPAAQSTPVIQSGAAIGAETVANLRELARWGKGRAELVDYSPDGRWLVVRTAQGSYVSPAQKPAESQYLEGSLAFAAGSQTAVTITSGGQVDLWQVSGWKRIAGWAGSQAVFSPDGSLLAVADSDQLRLVNVADGGMRHTLSIKSANRLLFSQDGALLVAANREAVQVWQIADGKSIKTFDYERVQRVAQIPGGSLLLIQGRSRQGEAVIDLFQFADLSKAASIQASGTLVFAPDGARLYAFSNFPNPGKIEIYSLPDGKRSSEVKAGGNIYRLSVSPDSKLLAASFVDFSASNLQTVGYLKTFDASGKELKRLDCGLACDPQTPLFSPDGKLLAVTGVSPANGFNIGSVFLFNARTGERARVLRGPKVINGSVEKAVFSPDGETLATLTGRADDAVRVWKVSDGSLLHTLEWGPDTLNLSGFSPDGRLAAAYSDAGLTRLLAVEDGKSTVQLDKSIEAQFAPRGEWIAAAEWASGKANGERLFRASNGELLTTFPKTFNGQFLFSPAENLAVLFKDFSVQIVKLPGGGFAGTLNATGKPNVRLTAGAFSPDGKLLAAGSANGEVFLWQMADKKQIAILEGHKAAVTALVFAKDGSSLLTGSSDGTVYQWAIPGGKQGKEIRTSDKVRAFPATEDSTFGLLSSLALSPDGKLIAVSGSLNPLLQAPARAGVTLVFGSADGDLLRVLPGGGGTVGFSADGKVLFTSGDGAVHLWGTLP